MKASTFVLLLTLSMLSNTVFAQSSYICPGNGDAFQELRIYEINPINREPFHARFAEHALRFMKKYGFTVVDMWESKTDGKLQLIYILSWPDKATQEDRWKAFRADPEWAEIRRISVEKNGDLLLAPTHGQPMSRLSYSPACTQAAPKR